MSAGKTNLVVTTIFEPAWLQGYLDNLRRHGHADAVTLRIICDRKTPATVYAAAAQAVRDGFDVDCPSLDEQQSYLRRAGLPEDFIPWNTDNRRNIGFLRAIEAGAVRLISIDDDNYCLGDADFVGEHAVVGRRCGELAGSHRLAAGAPWFNICSMLDASTRDPIFARGYPYSARGPQAQASLRELPGEMANAVVAVNAGLWLDDPDVDAITRLAVRPRIRRAVGDAVILGPETWSPINTQNTALTNDALPAYYYVRMGFALQQMRIDRFGDILSGYFLQKCAKHLGQVIRLGSPVAEHRRTPHNLFKDLYHELAGIVLIEELLPWLQELRLTGSSYAEAYASLADALEARAPSFKGFIWDDGGRDFLRDTAACMRIWLKALAR